MIGGNIPEETRVVSVQIYDYVEVLNYQQAHLLGGSMVAFSLIVLILLNRFGRTTAISAKLGA
jgi:molybdate transport system permease protein